MQLASVAVKPKQRDKARSDFDPEVVPREASRKTDSRPVSGRRPRREVLQRRIARNPAKMAGLSIRRRAKMAGLHHPVLGWMVGLELSVGDGVKGLQHDFVGLGIEQTDLLDEEFKNDLGRHD